MGSVVNKRAKSKGFAFFMRKVFHSVREITSFPYTDHIVVRLNHVRLIVMNPTRVTAPAIKYIVAWLALPIIAVFNGILRELTYAHIAGDLLAQQISSVLQLFHFGFF
jgi:hypothetical protein